MIPRTLVPVKLTPVKPEEARKLGHRLETYMDERTVVPSGPSDAPPLDGRTNIPAHFPLNVLVNRTLVPRGMPAIPLPRPEREEIAGGGTAVAVLDDRTVVPAYVEPASAEDLQHFGHAPEMTDELREVIQPDIFLTGDANLLIEPAAKKDTRADLVTRVLSILVHVGLIIFLIFIPKIFPAHQPTEDEISLAQKELNFVYMPPSKPSPPPAPAPKMKITPNILKRVAPAPIEQPTPTPAPVTPKPPSELPEAPRPQSQPQQSQAPPPPQQQQPTIEAIKPLQPKPNGNLNLQLPSSSPGREIHDQVQDAINRGARGPQGGVYPAGPSGPGGAGGPGINEGYQILSDTQGVDFSNYITRLLATLKRNWYPLMPESALLGDKGVVFTTFQINSDGSVPRPDPTLERTSGKEPLDNAAMGAIHASNPFEPLPKEFHGPYLKLRIIFIYNIPPDQLNLK
jgi:outer membrane biosynthesis protein TonB